jgi:NhaP-type Na+/H+ or K+/H+ antiporter
VRDWDQQGKAAMTRKRGYFVLMGVCLTLFILSWSVVRLYSVPAAVVISIVALVIPPIAVFVANAGDESSRRL